MPSSAATIGLGVTGVNALMTVVAIFLIDVRSVVVCYSILTADEIQRMGRKSLLLWSVSGMALTSAMLAFALDHDQNILSATAIILFIVRRPFLPIPVLVHAFSALSLLFRV